MERRKEDASVWIGYSDFLMTLVVLFLVLAASYATRLSPKKAAFLAGSVQADSTMPIAQSCLVKLGEGRQQRTDSVQRFLFRVDSLRSATNVGIAVECAGFSRVDDLATLRPGDTTEVTIRITPSKTIEVQSLSGDALFLPQSAELKPEAISMILALAPKLRKDLGSDGVVAVEGHTDDTPFPSGSERDNWMLSGERAASAARVLTSPVYGVSIPECQVAIMGFGPSRPAERVLASDRSRERARKREHNRRIEFRILRGSYLTAAGCVSD